MRFPSKLYSYSETVIADFPAILDELQHGSRPVLDLYQRCYLPQRTLSDFLDALVCLYVLGEIELQDGGVIARVN